VAIVTGIFGSCDPTEIQAALASASIDASKLKIVTKNAPATDADSDEDSILDFVIVAQAQDSNDFSDDITHGTNIVDGSGGTGVPGIGGRHQDLRSFGVHGTVYNYLGSAGIPADVIGNYNDAIEEGRCVGVYDATGGDADAVATAFRTAGFKNVKSF
jgi:rhodanese-related sulfurtransferase